MNTKLSKSSKTALQKWNRAIDSTLKTGKGKYKYVWVSDLYSWKSIINAIERGQINSALNQFHKLDTDSKACVPVKVLNIFGSW